jgi:hypothetical protein
MAADHAPKPNAFVHPNNPMAVFPQIKKPDIIDLRINRIKDGGLVAHGTFRKHLSKHTEKSPYATVVKATDDDSESMESDGEPIIAVSQKADIADLTAMAANLKIGKRKLSDAEMPALNTKSKGIKKSCKRLKR